MKHASEAYDFLENQCVNVTETDKYDIVLITL